MTKLQLKIKVADNRFILFCEKHKVITFLGIVIFMLAATFKY